MDALNTKWKNWVLQSLLAGQPANTIAATLNDNGFSPAVITRLLGANLKQPVSYRCPSARYQQLMNPAFLRDGCDYQVRALCDSNDLQLYAIDDFMSPSQCQEIVALARDKLKPSEIAGAASATGIRTSTTCDLAFLDDPSVAALNDRIVATLKLGVGESEVIQAQHYAPGEYYKPHYDFFPPGSAQFREHCRNRGQRTWTCMIYLNDNFSGGHTTFTKLGMSVQPKQGMALLWNNLTSTGEPNVSSIHYAQPVENGEKMVVTKWFRDVG
ncbi:prolyl hydroxylase family protein [Alteromonas halophila]|uniref:Fe2OG dioxygenase domain-containing protein n=1 Tax=Alteromonas halophila TaxID=516698 RepID=A0A918JGQ9_9ALTE|nr:2OG-Fe(II) oxygenase [Alteromonas halophila]GGW80583.1 hypothetical protein GCM10007391_11920 [Alteromonas halophila]